MDFPDSYFDKYLTNVIIKVMVCALPNAEMFWENLLTQLVIVSTI